ncbi:Bud22/Serum response factor-binding protein 1 [Cinara cedri]|uniref:Serum response factor-binding protein 1 n=1 Tax=Cinara cedri TaxID=506608 RepID=A0A5E4MJ05_9HEMI|nr:Bud22/Serum response factor-binding protein 1 [Cinara cedri]
MDILSKFCLNNQIVAMRHIVRKSKVHIINKLSREAKKLKEKKGNEKQIEKNKKKGERFVNELMVIKKLKDDIVTKYALQNEIPLATILNNIDITLEARALARLAGHKFITDAVQNFRNKYPDWKFNLTELLNELGSNYKTKHKKQRGNKLSKIKPKEKSKILEKNNKTIMDVEDIQSESKKSIESENQDEDYEMDFNKSPNITSEEPQAEVSLVNKMLSVDNKESQNNELKSAIFNKEFIDSERKIDLSKCDTIKQLQEVNVSNTQLPNSNLSINTPNYTITDNIDINKKPFKRKAGQIISKRIDLKKKHIMTDDVTPICETVDSFFMTTDDKDYLSVYKPPPIVEKNLVERPNLECQKPKEIFIKGKKLIIGKKNNIGNRKERRQQVEETVDTVLHPSWEAKRKQKSLVKFEGKKITFDDQE